MVEMDAFVIMVVRQGLRDRGIPDEKINEDDPFFIALCHRINELTALGHSYGGALNIALAEQLGGSENPNWDEMFKS